VVLQLPVRQQGTQPGIAQVFLFLVVAFRVEC